MLYNHKCTKHKDKTVKIISMIPEGGDRHDLPVEYSDATNFNARFKRMHRDKLSRTVDTGHRNYFHYCFNRIPTIRENSCLQTFPVDFVWCGSKVHQNFQVGNSVPPLIGERIGECLY